jgi:hypothetical protein
MEKKLQWKICNFEYLLLQLYNMDPIKYLSVSENNNPTLTQILNSKEHLTSFKVILLLAVIISCLLFIALKSTVKEVDNNVGYNIFGFISFIIAIIFIIKELYLIKTDPYKSIFFRLFNSTELFVPLTIFLFIFVIILRILITINDIGLIQFDYLQDSRIKITLNFLIIFFILIISSIIYLKNKVKDDTILNSLPQNIRYAFALRSKYTIFFIAFIIPIILLYIFNPYGITDKYNTPLLFFTLFIGIFIIMLITIYQNFLVDNTPLYKVNETSTIIGFYKKNVALFVIPSFIISAVLIYLAIYLLGITHDDYNDSGNLGYKIFNTVLFCIMLGTIYKLIHTGDFINKSPLYRLIINIIFYIPCLFVSLIEFIMQLFNNSNSKLTANKFEGRALFFALFLLGGYFLIFFLFRPYIQHKYFTQGGKQLINHPIPIDNLTNVAGYQSLVGSKKFDYKYAISFWFYIDSFPPSTNSAYKKLVPIFSYGDNPAIKYSSESNTLFITVKENSVEENNSEKNILSTDLKQLDETAIKDWTNKIENAIEEVKTISFGTNLDDDGNRIIYAHSNVLLQKWNHIVLNYNSGTLDIFYNGKLVKSAIDVMPYIKYDYLTVGSNNGIKGNIANLMYFKNPLDILNVHKLYTSLKNNNPPTIPGIKQKLVSLPNV